MRPYVSAAAGIVQRDARTYASYRLRPLTQLVSVVFSLALFYYVSRLVDPGRIAGEGDYFAFAVVGVAIMHLVTAAMTTVPATVRSELLTGTFERLIASPFGPVCAIAAMTVFPVLLAVAVATATIVVGGLAFGLDLRWATVPIALPIGLLAAVAFAPLAIGAVALALFAKRTGAATAYVVTGLSLTSGAFFPVALLPGWLRWVSDVQPLTPALDLLRNVLVGTPLQDPAALEVARLLGFACVVLPISVAVLGAVVRLGQRRGTLTEF